MKKLLAVFFVSLLGLQSMAQEDVSPAKWQAGKVVVDGNNSEWQKPFNFYDAASGLLFGIANDSNNLYLGFTNNDEMKARKLLHAGWKIELSSKEKNKKFDARISFPAGELATPGNKNNAGVDNWRKPRNDFSTMVNVYKLQFTGVIADGFKTNIGQIAEPAADGIQVNIGADSIQGIVYEIAIPLKELYVTDADNLTGQINLHVTVNELKATGKTGAMQHMGGRGGGMGGGRGMGSGRRGANTNTSENEGEHATITDRSALFEKASFKQKFRLVSSKI